MLRNEVIDEGLLTKEQLDVWDPSDAQLAHWLPGIRGERRIKELQRCIELAGITTLYALIPLTVVSFAMMILTSIQNRG